MTDTTMQGFEKVRTTITLPANLVRWSQQYIDKGTVPNRNALIVVALERFLSELDRQEIDRQFSAMADDEAYQEMNFQLSEAFADSDWEAFRAVEE